MHPSNWVWVHAQGATNDSILLEVASKGAWISLDGVRESNIDEYIKRIKLFKKKKLLYKLLLSHDGNGFPGGGKIRAFDALLNHLIPEMLKNGLTEEDVNQIMVINPRQAFTIKK